MKHLYEIFKRLSMVMLVFTLFFTTLPITAFSETEDKTEAIKESSTTSKALETYSTALSDLPLSEQSSEMNKGTTQTSKKKESTKTTTSKKKKETKEVKSTSETSTSELVSVKSTEDEAKEQDEEADRSGEKTSETINSNENTEEQVAELSEPETQDGEQAETAKSTNRAREALINYFNITDWQIIDENRNPLSDTNEAKSNTSYDFMFDWNIKLPSNESIKNNEEIVMPFLRNESWDEWGWQLTGMGPKELSVKVNGGSTAEKVGEWGVRWNTAEKRPEIYFKFADNIETLVPGGVNSIAGSDFEIPNKSATCYTSKGGIQNVYFGNSTTPKRIAYKQATFDVSNGYEFKTKVGNGSNNKLQYFIASNLAASLELTGDKADWKAYPKTGFRHDPANQYNQWGQYVTSVPSAFVTDELDPGVGVSSMDILSSVRMPGNLQSDSLETKRGGEVTNVFAFEGSVLAHNGKGPVYRTSEEDIKRPTEENSFKLIEQTAGQTKAAFEAAVKSAPYQYGIYVDKKGSTDPNDFVRTVMVNFGSISTTGGDQKKVSSLTSEQYSGKFTKGLDGVTDVPIPVFAVMAAEDSISRGFYSEAQRDLLEAYYTLTYGDSNALQGQIPTYKISLHLNYPVDSSSGEKTNYADLHYKTGLSTSDATVPKRVTAKHSLSNPYGNIVLNSDMAYLWKRDQDTQEPMNGVKFILQKKGAGNTWQDVTEDVTNQTELVTGSLKNVDGTTLQGGIKVEGLGNGTYRFVETETPAGYTNELSASWNNSEGKVTSKEFEINTNDSGKSVVVWNKQGPLIRYRVEHWLQREGEDEDNVSSYDLRESEDLYAQEGDTVKADPKNYSGWRYKQKPFEVNDIQVNPDGTTVLKLYYVTTGQAPFTIRKEDTKGNPMPSTSENKVGFRIYKFNWYSGGGHLKLYGSPEDPNLTQKEKNSWSVVENGKIFYTDDKGQIELPEEKNATYAFVEVETYTGYPLPSRENGYYIFESDTNGYIKLAWFADHDFGTDTTKVDARDEVVQPRYVSAGALHDPAVIRNHQELTFKKVDEHGNPMPKVTGNADKQMEFDTFKYIGELVDGKVPADKTNLWDTASWQHVSLAEPDENGVMLTLDAADAGKREVDVTPTGTAGDGNATYHGYQKTTKEDPGVYAFREMKTYKDYILPGDFDVSSGTYGFFLVYTQMDTTEQTYKIDRVETMNIPDEEDPGHIISDDKKTVSLKNQPKQYEFSFIKENEKKEPLENVTFELYQGKPGIELVVSEEEGGNYRPDDIDTYWDMTKPYKTQTSTSTGLVDFDNAVHKGYYLLVEKKTVAGYQLPSGFWIINVSQNASENGVDVAITGYDSPPAFRLEDGKYYLPNFKEYILPKAGGNLVIFLTIIGILLIGMSIWLNLNERQRRFN